MDWSFDKKIVLHESNDTHIVRAISRDGKSYILKILNVNHPSSHLIQRFEHEYKVTKNIPEFFIAKSVDFLILDGYHTIIFDDHEMLPLSNYLNSFISEEKFLIFAISSIKSLHEIHKSGVIHKDINPSNMITNPNLTEMKYIDFGIATFGNEKKNLTSIKDLEGTLAYIAPEQTGRINRTIDYRSDYYSLGLCFYHLLTNNSAFDNNDPMIIIHNQLTKPLSMEPLQKKGYSVALQKTISKMCSKIPDDRYQCTKGMLFDFEKISKHSSDDHFQPGMKDYSTLFMIPEKIYGREDDLNTILQYIDLIDTKQHNPLILISGKSGLGKSSIIQETSSYLYKKEGVLCEGKFDQFQKNNSFSAIKQALNHWVDHISKLPEQDIIDIKHQIEKSLSDNIGILTHIIPSASSVLGIHTEDVSSEYSKQRLFSTLKNFLSVIAQKNPILLFIDDLQWSDLISIEILDYLVKENIKNILFIGSYRSEEITPSHHLHDLFDNLQNLVLQHELHPLSINAVEEMIKDTLHHENTEISKEIIHKTGGNPFYVKQLLLNLHQEGKIYQTDESLGKWLIDFKSLQDLEISDNVVNFIQKNISQMPTDQQDILSISSCYGNIFDFHCITELSKLAQIRSIEIIKKLVDTNIISPLFIEYSHMISTQQIPHHISCRFKFNHDKLRESSYSLLSKENKQKTHYAIADYLFEQGKENIFDIVAHYNAVQSEKYTSDTKIRVANLNFLAAKKSTENLSYEASYHFSQNSLRLFHDNEWESNFETMWDLHEIATHSAFLMHKISEANSISENLEKRASTNFLKARVCYRKCTQYSTTNRMQESFDNGLRACHLLGLTLKKNPNFIDMIAEILKIVRCLKKNTKQLKNGADDLYHHKTLDNEHKELLTACLFALMTPAYFLGNQTMFTILIAQLNQVSIIHGLHAYSSTGFTFLAAVLNGMGDLNLGRRVANVGLKLSDEKRSDLKHNLLAESATIYLFAGLTSFLNMSWRHMCTHMETAAKKGYIASDTLYLPWSVLHIYLWSIRYHNIKEYLEHLNERYLPLLENSNYDDCKKLTSLAKIYAEKLSEPRTDFSKIPELSSDTFDYHETLSRFESQNFQTGLHEVHRIRGHLAYFLSHYSTALKEFEITESYKKGVEGAPQDCDRKVFYSLAILAYYSENGTRIPLTKKLYITNTIKKIKSLSIHCDETFGYQYHFLLAEWFAWNKFSVQKSLHHYEKAIQSASKDQNYLFEGIIHERCALFLQKNNYAKTSNIYIEEARNIFKHWGAESKVSQIEEEWNYSFTQKNEPQNTIENGKTTLSKTHYAGTGSTNNQNLDFERVLSAARSLSKEINLQHLTQHLMKISCEVGGASRSLLFFVEKREITPYASYHLEESPTDEQANNSFPLTVLNSSLRSQKNIIIEEAHTNKEFKNDEYIKDNKIHSICCLPIIHQNHVIAVLYLENKEVSHVFTEERLQTLDILASQASISIENSKLYESLEEKVVERTAQLSTALDNLKNTQDQLIESEKMASLTGVMSGVAHELNTPLGICITSSSSLTHEIENIQKTLQKGLTKSALQNFITQTTHANEMILTSCNRASELVSRFKQLAVSQTSEDISTFKILEHLNLLKSGLQGKIKEQNIIFQIKCPEDLLTTTYLSDLSNLLVQLTNNSFDHAFKDRENNVITISVISEGSNTIIYYKDNGHGIPEDDVQNIYEPFFSTAKHKGHTGLGLHLAFNLATQKLQGSITCETTLNEGTLFHITLPQLKT
ncbi:MAG: AAA family ATPase [Oligoflexales bacterium]